jgi:hypothetical protein
VGGVGVGGCELFVRKRLILVPSLGRMALSILCETVILFVWLVA